MTSRISVKTASEARQVHLDKQTAQNELVRDGVEAAASQFIAVPAEEGFVAELGRLFPANPFATSSYFESRRQLGYDSWVLGLKEEVGGLRNGCLACLQAGKLNRTLTITSLPAVCAESPFWSGLLEFCRRHRVTALEIGTFGSPPGTMIPDLGHGCIRRNRCEFVLDLAGDLVAMLGTNHGRNSKKARKAGLEIRQTRSTEAASVHQTLQNRSLDRRRSRGENAEPIGPSLRDFVFLRTCSGQFFQAVLGETVLSSVLVLHAPEGGYYQSAGTSPEGMALGASHFLIHSIAMQMKSEGLRMLNLGGADEESGLSRFKEGFGATRVPLQTANIYVGPTWRRKATLAISFLQKYREKLQHRFGR